MAFYQRFMEVLMIMYRRCRYRLFQHSIQAPNFHVHVKMKTKPSLVKFVESFLQFCISHEIEIHFEWDLKSLSLSQLLEAVGESACLWQLTPHLAPPSLHLLRIWDQLRTRMRMSLRLFVISNYVLHDTLMYPRCHHCPHTPRHMSQNEITQLRDSLT